MTMDLSSFKRLVRERAGLSFESARTAKLDYAVRGEMAEKGIETLERYYCLVSNSARDFSHLINRLTVNETYFFRELNHLSVFARRLVPELLRRKAPAGEIKIVSAGCSSGEEPYSLVMALVEMAGPGLADRCRVLGVDIDSEAIRRAKKGVYGKQSFRGFDNRLRAKHFEALGGDCYKIRQSIKKSVELLLFSLTDDPYPEPLRAVDVIFYRNVSIYFDQDMQRKIFVKLASVLNPGGYIITGAAETLSHNLNVLTLVEREGVFLYQKNGEPGAHATVSIPHSVVARAYGRAAKSPFIADIAAIDRMLSETPSVECSLPVAGANVRKSEGRSVIESSGRKGSSEALCRDVVDLVQAKEYDRSLRMLEELIAKEPSAVAAHALMANILMTLDRLDEAERESLKAIEMDALCLGGYLVLGMIARERADFDASIRRFREALYVSAICLPAHFYLAETFHSRGELECARRHYEILLNLAEKQCASDVEGEPFVTGASIDEMVRVGRFKLSQLKGGKSSLPHGFLGATRG